MFNSKILTVSQVNSYIKLMFEGDKNLKSIFISGEISNFRPNYSSGHLYFSLNEEKNTIRAVMFNTNLKRLRFQPENGMKVIVRGSLSVYEVSGQYQVYVEDMQPFGVGTDKIEIEKTKEKLRKEGAFDDEKKKKLPRFPKVIGIITSPSGAVIHDIKCTIRRRYPICNLKIFPVSVQGAKSEGDIIEAINWFNLKENCPDVIIIARGGGASEDLNVFNKEDLARTVANSNTPIISAIGHEIDWTLCDLAADMRASTPSAAAELAIPDKKDVLNFLNMFEKRLHLAFKTILNEKNREIEYLCKKIKRDSPQEKIDWENKKINVFEERLRYAFKKFFNDTEIKLQKLESRLELANPLNAFLKGYVFLDSALEKPFSISNAKEGQIFRLRCIDGYMDVEVKKIGSESFGE